MRACSVDFAGKMDVFGKLNGGVQPRNDEIRDLKEKNKSGSGLKPAKKNSHH